MQRLPSLNALRTFVVAARTQSFTAAALELHVTQGAVSRMVQALELELGILLFNRNGRFLTLTPAGHTYYQELNIAFTRIAEATQTVCTSQANQALQLVVNSGFAVRWLMPRLPLFKQQYPNIDVHILSDDTESSETSQRVDMIIRYGNGQWPGASAYQLPVGTLMGVVCSPQLKAARSLHNPADLLAGPLLTHISTHRSGFWSSYFKHYDLPEPDLSVAPRFHQLLLLAEAASAGMGFALVPLFLFQAELESGRLVQAIEQTFESSRSYYITHAIGADHDHKVQVFKHWLMEQGQNCRSITEDRYRQSRA